MPTLKTGVRGDKAGTAYFQDLMGGCRKLMALIGIPAETMAASIEEDGDEGRRLAALFREAQR